MSPTKKSVRVKQAAAYLGVHEATIWRWMKTREDFPKPRRLGPRTTVLDVDELVRFREACKVAA